MESRKFIYKETAVVAIGEILGIALMLLIFALSGHFDLTVLLGGIMGGILAVGNFFLMSYFAVKAADKAQNQDVAGGQKLIHLSYTGRMIGLLVALVLCAKSGWFHVLALAIPLIFPRPALTAAELILKRGGKQS